MIKDYRLGKKLLNGFIIFELCLVVAFIYLELRPVRTLDITQPIPVLNDGHTLAAGTRLEYRSQYCKYVDAEAASVKSLVGASRIYLLTTTTNNAPKGCFNIINTSIIIPLDVAPGRYHLTLTTTYRLAFHVPIQRRFVTEDFTVTGPQTAVSNASATPTIIVNGQDDPTLTSTASSQALQAAGTAQPAATSTPAPSTSPTPSPGLIGRVLQTLGL